MYREPARILLSLSVHSPGGAPHGKLIFWHPKPMQSRISALLGDLYEYTMAAAYHAQAVVRTGPFGGADYREPVATFELWVRRLPPEREFLIFCGLPHALDYLRQLRFTPEEVDLLSALPVMQAVLPSFWDRLRTLRFTGEVWAMAEGTRFFANQPVLRVTAPIIEAQIVETALLSILGFQTAIASKAARIVEAARGRPVIEFGARHAHGPQAAVLAARAAQVGGCVGTSNVQAGLEYGIPLSGTMAHSYVLAAPGGEDGEADAFAEFCELFPRDSILLLDTYDTLRAVDRVIARGLRPKAVRLDSGDLLELSREVRRRLDASGRESVQIVATSDLDEHSIAKLLDAEAPIDSFGIGTALSTSKDHPALSAVYKLVYIEGAGIAPGTEGRAKRSKDKETQPGKKQVWRTCGADGRIARDVVAVEGTEPEPPGERLLSRVLP